MIRVSEFLEALIGLLSLVRHAINLTKKICPKSPKVLTQTRKTRGCRSDVFRFSVANSNRKTFKRLSIFSAEQVPVGHGAIWTKLDNRVSRGLLGLKNSILQYHTLK